MQAKNKSEFEKKVTNFWMDNYERKKGNHFQTYQLSCGFWNKEIPVSRKLEFSFTDIDYAKKVIENAKKEGCVSYMLTERKVIDEQNLVWER